MLVESQIIDKYSRFESLLEKHFSHESRYNNIMKFTEVFQDRILTAPASSRRHLYSAFMGGYLTHILLVYDIAMDMYDIWNKYSNQMLYSQNSVAFVSLFHCIGKLGDMENLYYIPQTDEYRLDKYGEKYIINPKIQNMDVTDRTFWLLQKFNIEISDEEWLAIRLAAGMYKNSNKEYLSPNLTSSDRDIIQTNLPILLHHSTNMACRMEYEYWKYNDYEMFIDSSRAKITSDDYSSYPDNAFESIDDILNNL